MAFTLQSASPEQTAQLGRLLAPLLRADDVVLLTGELGAGKTVFTQGVAQGLGIMEAVNSPTFNLLLVHTRPAASASSVDATLQMTPAVVTPALQPGSAAAPRSQASAPAAGTARSELPRALYHFDLYRLDEAEQLADLDYWGLLEDGAASLVEWGDRFSTALPRDYLLVELLALTDGQRQMQVSAVGSRGLALCQAWQQVLTAAETGVSAPAPEWTGRA